LVSIPHRESLSYLLEIRWEIWGFSMPHKLGPEVKAEENGDDEEEPDTPEPAITALKLHSRTITSFVFPADGNHLYSGSYDSSIRKFDLQKGVAVEVFAPASLGRGLPISSIAIPSDPNLFYTSLHSKDHLVDTICVRPQIPRYGSSQIRRLVASPCIHCIPHLVATASLIEC
jgi:WD40 repeat protein